MGSTTSPLDEYVSREELARQLGKSVRTLDRWETMRTGPPRTKIGRSVLYRKEALSEWLREHELVPRASKKPPRRDPQAPAVHRTFGTA